jgi:[acyl-carrier-protein] S-malonyltransferase
MKKINLIFPGQGAQYIGMGNSPSLESYFSRANEALDYDLKNICYNGPEEELKLTANTQPAIFTHSVALYETLMSEYGDRFEINSVAGHSVGEYAALYAAGVISFEDGVKAVNLRGTFMQEATPSGVGAMYAIMRADQDAIIKACNEASSDTSKASPANFNEPSQVVISGHKQACEKAIAIIIGSNERCRTVELNVSAPFHCELMKPAETKLSEYFNTITFNNSEVPYIANIDAQIYNSGTSGNTVKENLLKQVCGSVLWTQSMQQFEDESIFLEVGPNKVLKGLLRRINKSFKVISLDQDDARNELEAIL